MRLESMKYCIATDKHNLLRDKENIIIYTIKKLYYKAQLYFNGVIK